MPSETTILDQGIPKPFHAMIYLGRHFWPSGETRRENFFLKPPPRSHQFCCRFILLNRCPLEECSKVLPRTAVTFSPPYQIQRWDHIIIFCNASEDNSSLYVQCHRIQAMQRHRTDSWYPPGRNEDQSVSMSWSNVSIFPDSNLECHRIMLACMLYAVYKTHSVSLSLPLPSPLSLG